jgi:hypothetical protein
MLGLGLRARVAVYAGLVLAVIVVLAAESTVMIPSTTTNSSSPQTIYCKSPVETSSPLGIVNQTLSQVFQMSPGASGTICVNYQFDNVGEHYSVWGSGLAFANNEGIVIYCSNGVSNPCPAIYYSASPVAVRAYGGGEIVTDAYSIQTGPDARLGMYTLYLGDAQAVPVVIGAVPTNVTLPLLECCDVPGLTNVTIAGVTNITTVMVPWGL